MNQTKKCPQCGSEAQFQPPSITDKRNKIIYVTFFCPNCGHKYVEKVLLQG